MKVVVLVTVTEPESIARYLRHVGEPIDCSQSAGSSYARDVKKGAPRDQSPARAA